MDNEGEARVGAFPEELPTRTFVALQRACRELGTELVTLDPAAEHPPRVDVLVGCVGPGERRIRPHYLERAEDSESLSLLLLTEDPLARPTVALEQGRVTLIERASPDLMRSRLRMLLSREMASAAATERVSPEFWIADSRARSELSGANAAAIQLDFTEELGTDVARLTSVESEWRLRWPKRPHSLWLVSPLRLPRATDLAGLHGGVEEQRLPSQSGDVVLALAEPQAEWRPEHVRELSRRSELGGPNIFDWACARFGGRGARVAVVEVR
jgi:hypothetical protein